jgi:hypothetical protein
MKPGESDSHRGKAMSDYTSEQVKSLYGAASDSSADLYPGYYPEESNTYVPMTDEDAANLPHPCDGYTQDETAPELDIEAEYANTFGPFACTRCGAVCCADGCRVCQAPAVRYFADGIGYDVADDYSGTVDLAD